MSCGLFTLNCSFSMEEKSVFCHIPTWPDEGINYSTKSAGNDPNFEERREFQKKRRKGSRNETQEVRPQVEGKGQLAYEGRREKTESERQGRRQQMEDRRWQTKGADHSVSGWKSAFSSVCCYVDRSIIILSKRKRDGDDRGYGSSLCLFPSFQRTKENCLFSILICCFS